MKFTRYIAAALIFTAPSVSLAAAPSQTYPTKPIRWLVPFGAGGAADIVSRLIAPKVAENLRQQVVIDNRPGGGTIIATELLANAAADGYTVMLANISFGANPGLHRKLPYDTLRDFAPVVLVHVIPNILLVHPGVPANSIGELIALAKAKPGFLNYGSAGVASSNHLNTELFKKDSGIDMVHIPYQSGGQLVSALLGTQVHVAFIALPAAVAHVKAGKLRVLGATGAKRIAALPDVPTLAEAALPGFVFYEWHGVFAPKGTPSDVIARLNTEVNRVLTLPDISERILALGAEIKGGPPAELQTHLKNEVGRWTKVLKPIY